MVLLQPERLHALSIRHGGCHQSSVSLSGLSPDGDTYTASISGSGPETLAAYKAAAANTTGGSSGAPDQVVGGTVELATAAASASTSATATVSTVTFAASGCPGNGMKKRRIAGREV